MTHAAEGARELTPFNRSCDEKLRGRRGELIGGTYRLVDRIGSGGMGEVYSAEHTRLGRQFAVKLLRADSEAKAMERFRREARAMARVENEYVVGVVDCGETADGIPYLVMDLLRGEDLRCLLKRAAPLSIPRAVGLVCDACQGVAAVHRAGLVHRDLKPGNLFVTQRSTGEDWCKVLDFGVAKTDTSSSTVEGALIGTLKYMAPEQLQDGASAGPGVDVYALGAILYESLSGVPPHSGISAQELMFKVMNQEPVHLSERRREVPARLADAVRRALSKSPYERFVSAEEFFRAIVPFSRVGTPDEFMSPSETVDEEQIERRPAVEKNRVRVSRRFNLAVVGFLVLVGAIVVIRGVNARRALATSAPDRPPPSASAVSTVVRAPASSFVFAPTQAGNVDASKPANSAATSARVPNRPARASAPADNRNAGSKDGAAPRANQAQIATGEAAASRASEGPAAAPESKSSGLASSASARLWSPDLDWLDRQK